MKPIVEYKDYRVYMADFYEERKRTSAFTWREFAKIAGFTSPSYLKLVCDGKSSLSRVTMNRVAVAMGLVGYEVEYFEAMVNFGNAQKDDVKKEYFDKMMAISTANKVRVIDEDAFRRDVMHGLNFVAENDIMLTMGVKPTRPEPGYGYIQMGEPSLFAGINKVQSFTEKPEREFANLFMESGEFLWNTGMFLANVNYLRRFFFEVIKDLPCRMGDLLDMKDGEEILQYVNDHYPAYPNLSMDKAALEMSDDVYVMRCNFGWADLGTWHAVYECMQKENEDNVVIDSEVILEECKGNIVKLPKGHIGVINGLEGYIVAEQGDVLLICKKSDSSALIRKYVTEVGIRYGEQYT
jgi:mannose-1-phosphate guanylyltransferase